MSDQITVEAREKLGSRNSRRLRYEGQIPAVLYGHGEEPVSLAVSLEQMRGVLRHGGKIVEMSGAASGQALLQDLQWDTFGRMLLHIDLLRVDASELLKVEIPVELKGDAPGEREGGMIDTVIHAVEIECPANAVPEALHLDISDLHLNGSITAGEITDLPEKAKLVTPPETMIVHCVPPAGEPESDEAVAAGGGEPEVIGKKAEEEGGE